MSLEPFRLTCTELLQAYRDRKLSPLEAAKSFADRAKSIDPKLHAWESLGVDRFMLAAEKLEADSAPSSEFLPVYGIPIGVKDCYNTEEFETHRGSSIYKSYRAGNDARVVRKARDCGALVLGTTKTAEFSIHEPSDTLNPWNLAHTPGTSSGGSAAAVASGTVPFAFGTQTAGSTSRPASYCGVVGFKPSFGLLPRTGVLKTTDTLDTLSYLTRSVEDARLWLEVLRVGGPNHPFISERMDVVGSEKLLSKLRIGVFKGPKWNHVNPELQKQFLGIESELSKLFPSSQVSLVEAPAEFSKIHDLHSAIYNRSVAYYFADEFAKHRLKISDVVQGMIESGRKTSAAEYHSQVSEQSRLSREFDSWMNERYDFLIDLGAAEESPSGLEYKDKPDNSLLWTFFGAPTLVVPKFRGPNGLPIGIQLVSRRYDDRKLLSFAFEMKCSGFITDAKIAELK